jgi:hypothetical protein
VLQVNTAALEQPHAQRAQLAHMPHQQVQQPVRTVTLALVVEQEQPLVAIAQQVRLVVLQQLHAQPAGLVHIH